MQRYIITEQKGIQGLKLEADAEVPKLRNATDVRPRCPRSPQSSITKMRFPDQNPNQSPLVEC